MVEFRDVVKKYAGTDEALGVPAGTVGGIPVVTPDDLGPAAAMTPAEVVTDEDAQAALSATFAKVFTPQAFGAKADGVTDDTAALLAAIDAAETSGGVFYLPAGQYVASSTLVISACDVMSAGLVSQIISSASPAVQIGDDGKSCQRQSIRLPRITPATPDTGVGVLLADTDACEIWVPFLDRFEDGLVLSSTSGVAYNTLVVGQINSYTRNVVLDPLPAGWINQNTFIGGRYTFSRGGTAVAGVRQVQLGTGVGQPNGNTFVGCSFEGAQPEYHVQAVDGRINTFVGCRFESSGGPRFDFDESSVGSYGNLFTGCYFSNVSGTKQASIRVTSSAMSVGNRFDAHDRLIVYGSGGAATRVVDYRTGRVAGENAGSAIYFDGTNGNFASLPAPSFLPTASGDLDVTLYGVRAQVGGAVQILAGHWSPPGQLSWRITLATNGAFSFRASANGTDTADSAGFTNPYGPDERFDLRVTRRESDGQVQVMHRPLGAVEWTVGSTSTVLPGSALHASTGALTVGAASTGVNPVDDGSIVRMELRDGIDGEVVASPDFSTPWNSRYRDNQGNVWTLTGSAWAWTAA